MTEVQVIAARARDRPVLWRLLQLYLHDFSEIDGRTVDERGEFEYRWFDHYWTDPKRIPLLVRVDGAWAGFALIRRGVPNQMAEFFVVRKHRRSGVGRSAAAECFRRFPGRWQIHEIAANEAAIAFWRAVIPGPYQETSNASGFSQRFEVQREHPAVRKPRAASPARSSAGRGRSRASR